jgi:hypothetical protein
LLLIFRKMPKIAGGKVDVVLGLQHHTSGKVPWLAVFLTKPQAGIKRDSNNFLVS